MPRIDFDQLPDRARLWTFGASRPLSAPEEARLLEAVDSFLDEWAAHGVPLRCAREWRHGRFLHVGVDEDAESPSGCSIDAMVRVLKDLERETGVTVVDNAPVWYRGEGGIERVSRAEFRVRAERGEVGPDTVVFDPTVKRVGALRAGAFERPARDSWHGRAFFRETAR